MPSETEPQAPAPTSRELSRFVTYYNKNVKAHSTQACVGVIKSIQRMLAKGITLEEIATALENYAKDPWRLSGDSCFTKHIRSFFTPEVIKEWQKPKPVKTPRGQLPEVSFRPIEMPRPVVVKPAIIEDTDEL